MKEIYKLLMVSTITIVLTMTVTTRINFASAVRNTTPGGECPNSQSLGGKGTSSGSIASGDTIDTSKVPSRGNSEAGGLDYSNNLTDAGDEISNPKTSPPPGSCLPGGG